MEQRVIKFRAWDGTNMLEQDGPIMGLTRGRVMKIALHVSNPAQEEETLVQNPGLILLQWTCLTDKNGKEIYEGDVVVHTAFPNNPVQVEFRDGAFYGKGQLLSAYHSSVVEVIGNIYENPELLNH